MYELLRSRGERLKKSGREWEWIHNDERITINAHLWYNQYAATGGDAVSFFQYFYNYAEEDAVKMLLGNASVFISSECNRVVYKKDKSAIEVPFELPTASPNMRRAFAYLSQTRGIDPGVIAFFAHHHTLYESELNHNVVFVGTDEAGRPRHAHMRGTLTDSAFRQTIPGSEKEYSFHHIGTSGMLYVFEAPIDLLSYITLHPENWQEHSYVALCCTGIMPVTHLLETYPQIEEVCLCLDNDEAGRKATMRIAAQLLEDWEVIVSTETPDNKDWNEDLVSINEAELQSPQMS